MNQSATDRIASLEAYPNLSVAAEFIGVDASTLSRREDLRAERRGDRDRVLRATEVLRLATIYRKRSLNDVAEGLIDYAKRVSPDEGERVREEVESFFEGHTISDSQRSEFLALARRLLPEPVYKEVEAAVTEQHAALPEALFGHYPRPTS